MSYDLMVFDPAAAPRDAPGFMVWYDQQTQWTESHGYDNPEVSAPALRAWFLDMIKAFPPLNGPLSSDENIDNPLTADYCLGRSVIYVAFGWPVASEAAKTASALAAKHGVGIFDCQSDRNKPAAIWPAVP